ncbi:MAG: gamma-glutamyltransferase [Pseudomonadota bacterium]
MPRFAVAAGHAASAEAGAEALRAGGSAVDACIAAALTACAVEPVLAGLLGGGFLMVREPNGKARLLDAFVQTPRRARPRDEWDLREVHADFGTATQAFHIGAASIASPGLAAGLWEAHARFGRVPMPDLAAPAVQAAARGAPLSAFQAHVLQVVAPIYTATPAARALYCPEEGRLARAGETLRNPELADVLDVWAREGARLTQEGEVAALLVEAARAGGHLTREDLAAYAPVWREPLAVERAGARLHLNPAPGLGGALIAFALEMMPDRPDAAALARAFALTARARLEAGEDGVHALLSPESLAHWRAAAAHRPATRGTTHVSAVDASGMAAALTLSNGEGCGLILPGTGLMPNNMLGEEDLLPGGLDRWRPDTRLASMMAPTILAWPGGAVAALGSGGSSRIRSAMASVLARLTDRGEALDAAIHAPRLHAEGRPPEVDFEDRFPDAERAALLAASPEARPWPADSLFFGGVHAVRRAPSGAAEAAADPRRDGAARLG